MGDFGVFSAPGQADFLQQRHLHRCAENFQKCCMKKVFEKFLEKLLNFPEIYFGLAGTMYSRSEIACIHTKKSKKLLNPCTPLLTELRDIAVTLPCVCGRGIKRENGVYRGGKTFFANSQKRTVYKSVQ